MEERKLQFMMQIVLIVSIFCIILSLILPLASMSVDSPVYRGDAYDFYIWGMKINIPSSSNTANNIMTYVSILFEETSKQNHITSGDLFFLFMLIILLPIVVFSLILAIAELYAIKKHTSIYDTEKLLYSGLLSITTVVLFYVNFEFGIPRKAGEESIFSVMTTINLDFLLGSFLLILSALMLFILYAISKYYQTNDEHEIISDSDEELMTTQKRSYGTGAISKEEYDQVKKDLER